VEAAVSHHPRRLKAMKSLRLAFAVLSAACGCAMAAELPSLDLFRDKEVLETFASIPVQESGRIKPLAKRGQLPPAALPRAAQPLAHGQR